MSEIDPPPVPDAASPPSTPDEAASPASTPDEAASPALEPEAASVRPAPPRRLLLRDYLETLLVAILVVLYMTTFVSQNSVIPTASMEDTLLVGDYLLVDKVVFAPEDADAPAAWLAQRPVRYGDVVVFKFPHDPKTDYIKRVIGLSGDVIEVRDKQVLRNGVPLVEPNKRHKTSIVFPRGSPEGSRDNFGPVTVPDDSLFVMGDNRDYSADSREWGFVPRSHVEGRAFVIFWSRTQAPGAWQIRGLERFRRFARSFTTFYRDTRWNRMFVVVK